jgi:hypothetical protein
MSNLFSVKSNIITFLDIQSSISNWTYLRCYCWCIDKLMRVILHTCCEVQGTAAVLCYVKSGPGKMQYCYNSSSSGCNIPLNVNPSMLVILLQFNARYTPQLLPNAAQILQITLSQHWSQSNKIYLQLLPFRLQYSIERISSAIGGLLKNRCVLYSTFAANTEHNNRFTLCQICFQSNPI